MTESESVSTELLHDLHTGMSDNALMEKYRLSYAQLRDLYKDLFDAGLLRPEKGSESMSLQHPMGPNVGSEVIPGNEVRPPDSSRRVQRELYDDKRNEDRYDLDFDMPVYEISQPEVQGRVVDITERGARLSGVRAEVGEALTLVALGDTMSDIAPFEFRARCKWISDNEDKTDGVSGFEITEISDESLSELRKLIHSIDLGI